MADVALIWAMSRNRVIGRDNALPWHLPNDLTFFKRSTLGHPTIMGRKTFDSVGRRPLPGRRNLIVTRDTEFEADGVDICHSLAEALELAQHQAAVDSVDTVFVAGGSAIYAEALPLADRLYLTLIDATIEGDAFFPDYDESQFQCDQEHAYPADERHSHPYRITLWSRRSA